MTLKEELEILRGEPIEVFDGDPMAIPCVETSDQKKLCKHPIVSVHMLTYNHEPYIRRAIEGVVMQKTDFEFELVIGEDCSQDKTREICFEYQKKYPEKIRVLWWHENVSRFGGNGHRVKVRCRGEFIAFCEGDDYWIDPLKLQKQVDVMRKHANVGFCFANGNIQIQGNELAMTWNTADVFLPGVITGREFFLKHLFGVRFKQGPFPSATSLLTASVLLRRELLQLAMSRYDIFTWKLVLGDTTLWLGLASMADCYYMPDIVCVYNQVRTGICQSVSDRLRIDGLIVRIYYFLKYFNRRLSDMPIHMIINAYKCLMFNKKYLANGVRSHIRECLRMPHMRSILTSKHVVCLTAIGWLLNSTCESFAKQVFDHFITVNKDPLWVRNEYKTLGLIYRYDKTPSVILRALKGVVRRVYRKLEV